MPGDMGESAVWREKEKGGHDSAPLVASWLGGWIEERYE